MSAVREVWTPPDLGMAVLHQREESCLRVWLLARALDDRGVGWVNEADLRTAVQTRLKRHPKMLAGVLKTGEGLWWRRSGPRVYLCGIQQVCERFGVVDSALVGIPVCRLERIGDFRAALLEARFAGKPRTMSLESLRRITGRSRRTVQNWLKRSGVQADPNWLRSSLPAEAFCPELAAEGYCVDRTSDAPRLVRRMANRYSSALELVTRHRTAASSSKLSSGALRRRYFDDPKAGLKALRRLDDGETLFILMETASDGSRLWSGHTRVEGTVRQW